MNVSQVLTAFFPFKNRHKNEEEEAAGDNNLSISNDQTDSVEQWNDAAHSRKDVMDYLIQQPSRNFYLGVYLTIVGKFE